MAYTAEDLYVNGLSRFGMNFPDGLLGPDNPDGVYSVLNAAISEFSLSNDWDFLLATVPVSTVAGTQTVALGSTAAYSRVLSVGIPSLNFELKVARKRDTYSWGTIRGLPRYFSAGSPADVTTLTLYPTPDAVYAVSALAYAAVPTVDPGVQGVMALYTYLSTIILTTSLPTWVRPLAELYVAKHAALLLKDREAFKMVSESIADSHRMLDDNNRKATAPLAPQTRQDW